MIITDKEIIVSKNAWNRMLKGDIGSIYVHTEDDLADYFGDDAEKKIRRLNLNIEDDKIIISEVKPNSIPR